VGYVVVGLFVVTWAGAIAVWRLARIEERWALRPGAPDRL
jgi:nickel/cobalt transporter (NiCoT) family protein